jgi:putative membrane protein
MNIIHLLITWLVVAVAFFIISKIPIGVEIDNFKKALLAAGVFGLLNALLGGVLRTITLPFQIIFSEGILSFLVNAIIFGLAAWLIEGFRLRWGVWSALLGALCLGIVQSLLFRVLPIV